jgi:hypothetical protein
MSGREPSSLVTQDPVRMASQINLKRASVKVNREVGGGGGGDEGERGAWQSNII